MSCYMKRCNASQKHILSCVSCLLSYSYPFQKQSKDRICFAFFLSVSETFCLVPENSMVLDVFTGHIFPTTLLALLITDLQVLVKFRTNGQTC